MNRFFATIILLAVAITMTVAAATWILTTYHSMMWKPEILRIVDIDLYLNNSDNKWWLKIEAINEGEGVAEIYKLEIHGIEAKNINPPKIIEPGRRKEIHIELDKEYIYGTMYTIRLYLRSGTVYPVLERIVRP